ncbi:hypothetical protein L1987_84908 [Smallanthus sonchifolius]|uniref:Uncharacterized protein n=1 Tax=Smallanthus sonchifolius TaxID=185202 RepID=A0ACB8XWM9_9ASTR|nr:hypothetical protein L1987_84908 [Smallanthus sonchifolius]
MFSNSSTLHELKLNIQAEDKDLKLGDVDTTVEGLAECLKKEENQTKLLSPSIYRVPNTLKVHNLSSFNPRMVSIGPLHRDDLNLQASEGEKAAHVLNLLRRLGSTQKETLQACARKVNASIDKIRSCYAETIIVSGNELAKMMVMDACFILEFLYRVTKEENPNLENEMFNQFRMYDLMLLENQIPFFVLEDIFECTISKFDQGVSLINLIHTVIKHVNPFKEQKFKRTFSTNTTHHHILSLLHECYQYEGAMSLGFSNSRFPTAVELDRAGVNFKRARDAE